MNSLFGCIFLIFSLLSSLSRFDGVVFFGHELVSKQTLTPNPTVLGVREKRMSRMS